MKKLLALILSLTLVLTLMPYSLLNVSAKEEMLAEEKEYSPEFENGFYYVVENGQSEIVDWDFSIGENVVIPATLGGYPVKVISEEMFSGCDFIKSLTISDGITTIEKSAFEYCSNLETINIPDSVISIGIWAFDGTAWYENQPDGIVYAGKVALDFKGECPETIILKEGTLAIASGAFYYSENLKSVTIPESVIYIGDAAFETCNSLVKIEVDGDNKNYLSTDGVLFDKAKTTLIKYPPCKEGNSYVVPETVTKIEKLAFEECNLLSKITLNGKLETIGEAAFWVCESLKDITIPDSVKTVGDYTFFGCHSLESFSIGAGLTEISNNMFSDCYELKEIVLADNIIKIGASAFEGCYDVQLVDLGENVKNIGSAAFMGCSDVSSITLPDSLISVGSFAFYGWTSLSEIIIPQSVVSIGEGAFANCSNLESITVPQTISKVEANAFDGTLWYEKLSDGAVYFGKVLYKYKGECPKEFVVKDGTTYISGYSFSESETIEKITIPESVKEIGSNAFSDCLSLKSVYITNLLAWMDIDFEFIYSNPMCYGAALYLNGEAVTHLIIPNTFTQIKSFAFFGCNSITTISLPKSVVDINSIPFEGMDALGTVYYGGSKEDAENIKRDTQAKPSQFDNAQWYYNACIGSETHSPNSDGVCSVCGNKVVLTGDCNGDFEINTTDLAVIKLSLAGLNELDGLGKLGADLNGDGIVNTTDLAVLKLKLAGIE